MTDQQITCADCGGSFVFTQAEQAFYSEKGLSSPPKRCKACRAAKKAASPDRASRPDRGGFRPDRARSSGPGGGGGSEERGAWRPRADAPARGGWGSSNGANDRAPARTGGPRTGGDRFARPNGAGGDARGPSSAGRPPPRRNDGPAPRRDGPPPRRFDGPPPRRGDGPPPRSRPAGHDAERASFSSEGASGESAPADAAHKAAPAARERPPRPRYDITCMECGAAAQVPFKPVDGRQIFCQPCYRLRKGASDQAADGGPIAETDAGIVE